MGDAVGLHVDTSALVNHGKLAPEGYVQVSIPRQVGNG
jgi:hypothetical protein